jgi:hypothetical protein
MPIGWKNGTSETRRRAGAIAGSDHRNRAEITKNGLICGRQITRAAHAESDFSVLQSAKTGMMRAQHSNA